MNRISGDLKVLFFGTQMTVGGAQRSLLNLARWFQRRGYTVTAAFLYDKDGLFPSWQAAESFELVDLHAWRKGAIWSNFLRLPLGLFRFLRLYWSHRFDGVMTFTQHSNLIGIPAAWLAKVPVRIASNRGRIDGIPLWMERLHGVLVNSRLTSCLVTNSAHVCQQALEIEGVRTEKIVIIPNGVEIASPSQDSRVRIRHELGIAQDANLILSIGRLTDQKGHITLIRAIPHVLEKFPAAITVLVGDGEVRPVLEETVQQLGIAPSVRFTGTRTDVSDLLAATDIFVLPSISEGMPNALLEAMGLGVPSIASDLGAMEGIVTQGETGLLVPPADAPALAESIIQLLSDGFLRSRLAQNGKNRIETTFTLDAMCEKYEQLFSTLM